MASGRFITFEGGEGAGKSTQVKLLAQALAERGRDVVLTREPGGSTGAEEIRKLLVSGEPGRWDGVTEALLHYAARRDHLTRTVWPALSSGSWVVSDRFADSTMAYQGYGHALGREPIERLHAVTVGEFAPDLTLILDLPPKAGVARANARRDGEDRYERMDVTFHERLRDGFLDIAAREPNRCVVIDASGSVEAVHAAIMAEIAARFPA
ncbi:thymidylate kinase [Skermanella stibiiresistens SB22]|uniref:Thymidylate kinase n=1 Tax=Skermanella stibiiresistens SB22 TaxID=1385369 RepID=W9HC30_9PROT|nr:dTMP kinase [Skermanella stibiiresistens]EWY42247.1 thymidylate kinase [Skermanella stibiiresistens SB22]